MGCLVVWGKNEEKALGKRGRGSKRDFPESVPSFKASLHTLTVNSRWEQNTDCPPVSLLDRFVSIYLIPGKKDQKTDRFSNIFTFLPSLASRSSFSSSRSQICWRGLDDGWGYDFPTHFSLPSLFYPRGWKRETLGHGWIRGRRRCDVQVVNHSK